MVRNVPCSSIDRAARHQKAPVMPEALQDAAMDRSDAGLFATTQWSLVLRARDKSQAAVSALCGSYWQPAVRWLGLLVESLDETAADGRKLHEPSTSDAAPDREYDQAWAHGVLANALRRLQEECASQRHALLCYELMPVMFADETASPYQEIASKLEISENAVKVAAHRMRARLGGLIRDEVRKTVASQEEWREELCYLIQLFSR